MSRYRRFLTTFSLLLLVLFVNSLASAKSNPGEPSSWLNQPPALQTEPVSAAETTLDVFITDEGIFPPVLTVSPGVTIRWTNQTSSTQNLEGISATAGAQTIYLPLIFNNATSQSNKPDSNEPLPANTPAAAETAWQSGDILPGNSYSQTFDESGTYAYTIVASPTQTGAIVVQGESFAPSIASIITVNTYNDDNSLNGNCTLREAVIAANKNKAVDDCPAGSTSDIIALDSGVYNLTLQGSNENAGATGDLDITSKITITGAGDTIIDAASLADRIFHVDDWGKLTLSDVNLRNGHGFGGGIYNRGTLTLNRTTISDSVGGDNIGGGFKNDGYATINESTISGNTANMAAGIYNRGILTLNNSTVSGNTAGFQGGGIKNEGTLALNHTTVTNNTAQFAGGVRQHTGTVTFQNSIIAGNTSSEGPDHSDCDNITDGSLGHNLVGNNTGCPTTDTDITVNPADVFLTVLGPLQNNGGDTETHALLAGSPAIDGVPLDICSLTIDQRGIARPQNTACDIGSFELEVVNPILVVNTAADTDDGQCDATHCTLREAINAANARPNTPTINEIQFNIAPGGPQVIQLLSALPVITDPVKIDGSTQPGYTNAPIITLDGSQAGSPVNGLNLNTGNSSIKNLAIRSFSATGIQVTSGISTTILSNSIYSNTLGLDLGTDGVTPNDAGDPDTGPNNLQNFPVLTGAFPNGSSTRIEGRLNSTAVTTFTLEFFVNPTCNTSNFGEGQTLLGTASVQTDETGDAVFTNTISFPVAVPLGQFVTATATGPDGTSEFSQCVPVSLDNDSWPTALRLDPSGGPAQFEQALDLSGQSRWYKFRVQPDSRLIVTLTNLPANYDLTVYKDISAAFNELLNPEDLTELDAEFAPDAFAAEAFARGARTPDAFAPEAFAAGAFAPDAFAAEAFARGARTPDAIARGARTPDAFAPDAYAPDAYAPDALARGARTEDAIARGARTEEAFSSAQTRSLIGISAFEGTSGEGVVVNTWNNAGDFYVRVRGRNGAFSPGDNYRLEVTLLTGACNAVNAASLPSTSLTATGNSFRTLILADWSRMQGDPDLAALQTRLTELAARPEVGGEVVNVGQDARVAAANAQADTYFACPYAKNLVAEAIKNIVDRYRAAGNPLKYVVIVGNDNVIPFFRYPDTALLGPESEYAPPVFDDTASQASLKLNYVLGQDAYGSTVDVSLRANEFPIPDLAVGRLVETGADMLRVVNAYMATSNGVITTPATSLVTGYDFFDDAAEQIRIQLSDGIGIPSDTLITPATVSPLDSTAWTADQLRTAFLGRRNDIVFLGGHFSASSALAADYQTRLLTSDLVNSPVNLENALIFSIGCHSGYNIVNPHGIPGITREPDWAQAFAGKGATFIGGTGYQYGDTDYIEYSERIYLEFSRQLRLGSGPVSIGQALVASKQAYLAQTPELRGLHEKSLLISTLFGLPMLQVNLPNRLPTPTPTNSAVGNFDTDPDKDLGLGLEYADITVTPSLSEGNPPPLKDFDNGTTISVSYLQGSDGIVTHPLEPVLPLEVRNVSTGLPLRGVGFRGGNYTGQEIIPLTGAPATEIRGVHSTFFSDIFYPVRPWTVNYFDALAGGETLLAVTPAQHRSVSPGSDENVRRQFDSMDFRLYYSGNINSVALSAAPSIADISTIVEADSVGFRVTVVGNPDAGIQEVWVTYTTNGDALNGQWQSLDLTQNSADSRVWEGTLTGVNPADIRFMVQAVNGVGLVSLDTNLGAYYIPGFDAANLQATTLELSNPGSTGRYGESLSLSAVLTSNSGPLAGQLVTFGLGSLSASGVTGSDGQVTVSIPLLAVPGSYAVTASFAGTTIYAPAAAEQAFSFTIAKQNTSLLLTVSPNGYPGDNALVVATLTDINGLPLREQTIFFKVTGSKTYSETIITNFLGQATLGNLPLPPGNYTVNATFGDSITLGSRSINLVSDRYNPSSAAASLILQNTPPVAVNDTAITDEDTPVTINVLANDSDSDGDTLTVIKVSNPLSGTVSLNANGTFTYTPKPNFNGTDSFTYKVNDGTANSNTATVTITVEPINDAPVATKDSYNVEQNKTLSIAAPGVLSNDTDIDSATLTALLVSGPTNGTLTLQANGAFTYTPNYGFTGSNSFTYKANDGSKDSNVVTVTITVTPAIPSCLGAEAYPEVIWSPNNKFKSIAIKDVEFPNTAFTTFGGSYHDKITIKILTIFQDELVGTDKNSPDGQGIGTSTAQVRSERNGTGNGRVYHIGFMATNKYGSCVGTVRVAVPNNQSGEVDIDAIDEGPLYDSTKKSY